MRHAKKIALLCFAVSTLAILVWWFFYASYVKTIKNLPKQFTAENYFQFLDALSHLPSTEMPLNEHPHPKLQGGPNTSAMWRAEDGVGADLIFTNVSHK